MIVVSEHELLVLIGLMLGLNEMGLALEKKR